MLPTMAETAGDPPRPALPGEEQAPGGVVIVVGLRACSSDCVRLSSQVAPLRDSNGAVGRLTPSAHTAYQRRLVEAGSTPCSLAICAAVSRDRDSPRHAHLPQQQPRPPLSVCSNADFKRPLQIHYIADNIMCCGAGTAADTEFTTAEIRSQIALHKLNTGREPRVVTAMTMLKQKLFQ